MLQCSDALTLLSVPDNHEALVRSVTRGELGAHLVTGGVGIELAIRPKIQLRGFARPHYLKRVTA